jgi:hypothetical protein
MISTFEQFCKDHSVTRKERLDLIYFLAAFRSSKTIEKLMLKA